MSQPVYIPVTENHKRAAFVQALDEISDPVVQAEIQSLVAGVTSVFMVRVKTPCVARQYAEEFVAECVFKGVTATKKGR
jgi:hypothetical protein